MSTIVEVCPSQMPPRSGRDGLASEHKRQQASAPRNAGAKARATSIPLSQSVRDWWASSSESASQSSALSSFRSRNHQIEYDLYRAILSPDIYIVPPGEMITDDVELQMYPFVGQILDIDVDDGNYVHEFYLQNNTGAQPTKVVDVVIIHGYMAASGYFLKNFEQLLKSQPGIRIHAIDLLGFGNSSRPKFPPHLLTAAASPLQEIRQTLEIESWFIDAIESWRLQRGLLQFKLIAHSMGAYLLSCYLMKYNSDLAKPPIVEQFIAVSPMGTEPSYRSLLSDERDQVNHHAVAYGAAGDPFKELTAQQLQPAEALPTMALPEKLWDDLGRPKFPKVYILRKLWEWNKSPFQMLQLLGPFYSKILSYWSFQRFANLIENTPIAGATLLAPMDNTDLVLKLHYYSFSIFNQYQGSGELAITKLINHEILARLPLSDRGLVEHLVDRDTKTLWLYGDKDWMNSKGGMHICDKIATRKQGLGELQIINGAGHHIYLDNPTEFNKKVISFFGLCD